MASAKYCTLLADLLLLCRTNGEEGGLRSGRSVSFMKSWECSSLILYY